MWGEFDKIALLRTHGSNIIIDSDSHVAEIKRPMTLAGFRNIWDSNLQIVCARSLQMQAFTTNSPIPIEFTEIDPQKMRNPLHISFDLRENSRSYFQYQTAIPQDGIYFSGFYRTKDNSPGDIYLPVKDTIEVFLDFRAELREIADQNWMHAEFKDAFYELDQATTGFQKLSFADLSTFLQQKEESAKENFEAFGIKFPANNTSRWGVLLILGIQLYFWLHVAEYRHRNLPKADVAWIGTYSHVLSRIIFFATSVPAPIVVVGFLLFFQREQAVPRVWADLALLCSGTMAAISWHEHRRSNLSATVPLPAATAEEARSAAQGQG